MKKVIGDRGFDIRTDKEMREYETRCSEHDRVNSAQMPKRLKELTNKK